MRDQVEEGQPGWLRLALSSIGDAVIATDAGGRVTFMNGVAESLTGWPLAEAAGRPLPEVFRIVNEHTRKPAENPALRALREGAVVGLANHTVLIARDGSERPIDDSAAPMREGDAMVGAVLVFRDVTERKRAEQDRARLAAIVESSEDAIVSKSLDGTILSWNGAARRLFGYDPGEAVGRPITMLIPPELLDEERSILERLRRGERVEHFETVRVAKGGRRIDVSLSISPVRNAEGQVVGASKVARDVTQKKRDEAERARLAETLGLALSAADLGTWDWDPATDLITLSARAAEIYGVEPGPHGREKLRGLIHEAHRDRARQEAARAVAERADYDVEYPLVSGAWVAARGRGVYDAAGAMARMLGVVADVTARKKSEVALRDSEARYRALVTASSDVVYRMSADWSELEPLDGRGLVASNDAPLRGWMERNIPAIEHDRVRAAIAGAIAGRRTFEMEHQVVRADGGLGWTFSRAVPILDADGEVVEWFGTASDVTRRKEAEEGLRDVRSRMEAALEAGAIGTWTWDVQADRFHGDASLAKIFGLAPGEVAGGPLAGVLTAVHPEDRERVAGLVGRAVESCGRYEADYRVRAGAGWRWVTARGQAEPGPGGRTARLPGVVIDVTERKAAVEALARVTAESERRRRLYETALSNTPDLVYVFDLGHRFTYANEALLAMWGKAWDEAIGKTCLELGYEPWHAAMHDDEIERVVATRLPVRGEVPFTGTGGRRVYEYIFAPVLGAAGEVEAVAGTTRDVTERQAMEQELREADRKKDDFIALLAHELRNPLAPIRNGLQVVRLAGSDPRALAEARSMMERQLSHMVRLIDDLLDVSRISRNKMELRRARVPLAEVVASAVETARPLIDEAGHELSVSLPAAPAYLDADLTRLAQVFSNLLSNSAKYTPPGGRVWLSAERNGGHVEVSVRDTGIGIPAGSLVNIFDMFSQVGRTIERSAGGLGIGLALVKGLVEMHGGAVAAASPGEGGGSVFTVTLPVLAGPAAPAEPGREGPRGPSRRFLVVDDNRDGADSLALTLRLLGNEVRTAYDGAEAVTAAEGFRPEVVLMDVGMPRMNGLDATRRIREQPWGGGLTIIALTGWGQENDRERSRAAGCDGHLVKPVSLPDLEKMLAGVRR